MQMDALIEWATVKMGMANDAPMEIGYRLHHGQRVAQLAIGLAKNMQIDADFSVLNVAGTLHDIGKSGGQPGAGHGPRGADIIQTEIPHLFSSAELTAVCDVVANHYMRPKGARFLGMEAPMFSNEVLLVQDADILDHFGCTGIYLNMYWNAHYKESPQHLLEQHRNNEAEVERTQQLLNFPASKLEFVTRWQAINDFYALLGREEAGELIHLGLC